MQITESSPIHVRHVSSIMSDNQNTIIYDLPFASPSTTIQSMLAPISPLPGSPNSFFSTASVSSISSPPPFSPLSASQLPSEPLPENEKPVLSLEHINDSALQEHVFEYDVSSSEHIEAKEEADPLVGKRDYSMDEIYQCVVGNRASQLFLFHSRRPPQLKYLLDFFFCTYIKMREKESIIIKLHTEIMGNGSKLLAKQISNNNVMRNRFFLSGFKDIKELPRNK